MDREMTEPPAEIITGAQSLVRARERVGVDTIFGIPGGAILPAYDPLFDSSIRHVLVRHEQGAGHAAEGYAMETGKVGVCMATSGPGATNLVTAIADAYLDSVPIVAITGQVASGVIGSDAFQEADIRGITMPITKHSFLVTDPADIPSAIAEAFHIASTGRPGPVLVDISKDALQGPTSFRWPHELALPGYRPTSRPHNKQIREAAKLIAEARKPVLYVGGGVIKANAAANDWDPDKVAAIGHSAGGNIVGMLAASKDDPELEPNDLPPELAAQTSAIVAGVALTPVADLKAWEEHDQQFNSAMKYLGCMTDCDYAEGSVPTYVNSSNVPLWAMFGTDDVLAPPSDGKERAEAYEKAGIGNRFEYVVIDDGPEMWRGHNPDIQRVIPQIQAFLDANTDRS